MTGTTTEKSTPANALYTLERLVCEAIARQAGQYASRRREQGFEISLKGKNDIVTTIDVETETLIKKLLHEAFPADAQLGEESGATQDATGRRWVIDPIDGTLNFSIGVPLYSVSIALQIDGVSVAGAVYDPSRHELFSASLGGGAALNGKEIHASDCDNFEDAVLVTGFPPLKNAEFNNLENFTQMCRHARAVRRLGSAALDLCYVAAGRLDGFWEFRLKPWDTAAGYLIVQEAGGKVSTIKGEPYHGYASSLVTSNGRIHDQMLQTLTYDDPEV